MSAVLPLQRPARAPLGAIAKAFLTVSVFGFGGGIVWARRIAVEQQGWLSDAEFLDIVSLCQFLPGPNIIGIAVCTGTKLRGAPRALAAIAGVSCAALERGFGAWCAAPSLFAGATTSPCARRSFCGSGRSSDCNRAAASAAPSPPAVGHWPRCTGSGSNGL